MRATRLLRYSMGAALAVSMLSRPGAAQPAAPEPGPASFTLFVRGTPLGVEQVDLSSSPEGWTISSTGRFAPPLDLVIRRYETRYDATWMPREVTLETTRAGQPVAIQTTFADGAAATQITEARETRTRTDEVSERTLVVPNNIFAGYEAIAARLSGAAPGDELPVYILPQGELTLRVNAVTNEQIRVGADTIDVRRHRVTFLNPNGPLDAEVWADGRRRLVRLSVPLVGIDYIRSDIGSISARRQTVTHPGDEDVWIPARGFSLAATLTRPVEDDAHASGAPGTRPRRRPAVVLVAGAGTEDRDHLVDGVPVFGQLASALADRGFIVVRYDNRGIGQSGGRAEAATIESYAEDVRAAVRFLEDRDDVDRDRIAVAGYGEGGWIALIAAEEEDDRVAAVVLLGAPGTTGAALVLEQQRRALVRMDATEAEQQEKIALQERIHAAVLGDGPWDGIPETLRRQADTRWFRSFLTFDPAEIIDDVRQPMLIVHGSLDAQIPPQHAERLAALGQARDRRVATDVTRLEGLDHLLVRAGSGESAGAGSLTDRRVSPDVAAAVAEWLTRIAADAR